MGKRGPKPKEVPGKTETFHRAEECGVLLTELKAMRLYGRSNGKVICLALKHLKAIPPTPEQLTQYAIPTATATDEGEG